MITFFYPFGYFLFVLIAHLLTPFNKKVRKGVFGRYATFNKLKTLKISPERKVFWFHVASSGEFEQVMPILDLLKETKLNPFILVTYYSPSGERSIGLESARRQKVGKTISWDFACYSPFDFKFTVKTFLQTFQPSAFVAIHREIWPSLLTECSNQKIPCFLFSAYFPMQNAKSFWKYAPWLKFFKWIGTVDDESAQYLKTQLPALSVSCIGDSRIERVVSRRKLQNSPAPYATFFEKQKVIVVGSVWPKDFEKILQTVSSHKDKRFIFAPHEPNTAFNNKMIQRLKEMGLQARLWSRWLLEPDTTSHLIFDSVGGLFELYSIAYLAIVGGGFVKRVHNVLEPAAYGLPIITGPFIENSREAIKLLELNALFKCTNSESICQVLAKLDDPNNYSKAKQNVEKFILDGLGASEKYVEIILPVLGPEGWVISCM